MNGIMSKNDLKPCPFCGGHPILEEWGNGMFRVACVSCGANSGLQKDADKVWNKRMKSENKNGRRE